MRVTIYIALMGLLSASAAVLAQSGAVNVSPPLRIAVIGLVHPHANEVFGILKRNDVQVVGISDRTEQVRADYVKKGLDPRLLFDDEAKMIEQTRPQAVLIYTNTFDHRRVVEIAARYGVHAMMEKPLAVSNADAQAMVRVARKGNIHVLVNFDTTWYPSSTAAYQTVQKGIIGAVRKIVVHDGHSAPRPLAGPYGWLADPKLNGGGALYDFGCYGANLVAWLMGGQRPLSVTAVTQTIKPEVYTRVDDEATVILTYPKTQAILQPSWNWAIGRKDIEIYGEEGYAITVRRDGLRVRLRGKDTVEEQSPAPPVAAPHNDMLTYLRAVVLDGMKPMGPSSLEINLIATEILDAARKSARTGKRVDLPRRVQVK